MLSLSAEHVAAFYLFPRGPDRTTVVNEFLFHPVEMAKPAFDPSDAVDFVRERLDTPMDGGAR